MALSHSSKKAFMRTTSAESALSVALQPVTGNRLVDFIIVLSPAVVHICFGFVIFDTFRIVGVTFSILCAGVYLLGVLAMHRSALLHEPVKLPSLPFVRDRAALIERRFAVLHQEVIADIDSRLDFLERMKRHANFITSHLIGGLLVVRYLSLIPELRPLLAQPSDVERQQTAFVCAVGIAAAAACYVVTLAEEGTLFLLSHVVILDVLRFIIEFPAFLVIAKHLATFSWLSAFYPLNDPYVDRGLNDASHVWMRYVRYWVAVAGIAFGAVGFLGDLRSRWNGGRRRGIVELALLETAFVGVGVLLLAPGMEIATLIPLVYPRTHETGNPSGVARLMWTFVTSANRPQSSGSETPSTNRSSELNFAEDSKAQRFSYLFNMEQLVEQSYRVAQLNGESSREDYPTGWKLPGLRDKLFALRSTAIRAPMPSLFARMCGGAPVPSSLVRCFLAVSALLNLLVTTHLCMVRIAGVALRGQPASGGDVIAGAFLFALAVFVFQTLPSLLLYLSMPMVGPRARYLRKNDVERERGRDPIEDTPTVGWLSQLCDDTAPEYSSVPGQSSVKVVTDVLFDNACALMESYFLASNGEILHYATTADGDVLLPADVLERLGAFLPGPHDDRLGIRQVDRGSAMVTS